MSKLRELEEWKIFYQNYVNELEVIIRKVFLSNVHADYLIGQADKKAREKTNAEIANLINEAEENKIKKDNKCEWDIISDIFQYAIKASGLSKDRVNEIADEIVDEISKKNIK